MVAAALLVMDGRDGCFDEHPPQGHAHVTDGVRTVHQ